MRSTRWPTQYHDLLTHLLLRRRCQPRAKEIDANHLVAQCLRNTGQQLARADQHLEERRLVADDITEHSAGTQEWAQLRQMARHPAKVEARHPRIEPLEAGGLPQFDAAPFNLLRQRQHLWMHRNPGIVVVQFVDLRVLERSSPCFIARSSALLFT